jgi:hypothetical protein
MKASFIFLCSVSLIAVGCSNPTPDDSTTKFTTSNTNQHWEAGKVIDDSVAVITPTLAQGFHYSNLSIGYAGQKIAAIILLAIGGLLFFGMASDRLPANKLLIWGAVICLFGSSAFYFSRPGTAWLNNKKSVPIKHYKETINQFGTSRPLWDSIYQDNRMVGAPIK